MQVRSTSSPGRFHQSSRGEDFDLLRPVEAGLLDHAANAAQVDDAVAHHAAVEQQSRGRHQPVADVVREDAARRAGARDLSAQLRVPPDVIGVDGDADVVAQLSQRSSAWPSVFTQARSAAYIGCSGSIASGMLQARA